MDLSGKIAVVTGAGQGIGEGSALRLAEAGASVVCVDIDRATLDETVKTIRGNAGSATGVVADVSTREGNREMVARACAEHGRIDIFHANAGVTILGRIDDFADEVWDRLHDLNLKGVYLGIKETLPVMRANGGGSVIITASVLGLVGDPDLPAYGATKGGLRAMCRSLAVAHGPENIRFNTVCPGDVETPGLKDYFDFQPDPEAARREITARYPMRRFASPRDVGNAVAFLASDDAAYITGTDIIVDGGILAKVY
ncbi:SDR family NAD(P)-dependent oxidoreductase [Nonomuraea aurantiaca]|jgi:NAD(P)-dependent dehydrogenase (short-subunit alcohol dehydrogenase family)|uniref:SDR family NAD(P)-dependent oxidoreductase n=1 Tax=Nonomuraea aurantiaca TaxID=2878562 RepID=UPI001CD99E32|nr:SDR family NAD(P)-dependent oxidoreductase [Nonomuraea aurantiaca]MCA2220807.1 SDR family oxidoreductase [Nonomuraea aurantiaca]